MTTPMKQLSAHASARSDAAGNAEEESNTRMSALTTLGKSAHHASDVTRELVISNDHDALEAAARKGRHNQNRRDGI